ncbi:MAG: hypothetical protein U0234_18200 [Sandaracinus sp.]
MSPRPRPRPRFQLETALDPKDVRDRVLALIKKDARLRGIAFEHRLEIGMGQGESHFYSPQLVAKIEPRAGGGSVIHARFGPDAYVWAFYVMGTGALTVLTLFASILGLGQWYVGMTPVAFVVAPIAAVAAGLVYGASYVGQGLGYPQMHLLRATLTEAIDATEPADG